MSYYYTRIPILVHLSEYVYKFVSFLLEIPSNFNNSIHFITKLKNFCIETNQMTFN